MGVTRLRVASLTAAVTAALVFCLARPLSERAPWLLGVPWPVVALLLVMAGVALAAAWPVRQYIRGKRRWTDPLRAARVVAFAKACALAGSGLVGAYLGLCVFALSRWDAPAFHGRALWAGGASLAALALAAAGLAAERWCRLPPADGAEEAS
jgi:hypothetical protein